MRHPLGVDHLLPDRGVGGAAADREVVGLDDQAAAVGLALPDDHVRGHERLELAVLAVAADARQRARLVERAGVEQPLDPLAHGQLAGRVLALHARGAVGMRRGIAGERLAAAQLLELGLPGHGRAACHSRCGSAHVEQLGRHPRVRARRDRAPEVRARGGGRGARARRRRAGRCGPRAPGTRSRRACRPTGRSSTSAGSTGSSTPIARPAWSRPRRASRSPRSAAGCDELGLALPNLGDIDAQTLAGALATGTHGTGARLQNLSAQVEALELVDGTGERRTLTGDDGDLLRAARIGLGSLGIVTAVTLRCVPAFRLRGVDATLPLEEVLATLDERADAHDHFEFWTFPHSPLALTRDQRPHRRARRRRRGRGARGSHDVLLDNHALELLSRTGRRFPRAIPRINRLAAAAASGRERVDGRTGSSPARGSCASTRWSTRSRASTRPTPSAAPARSSSATPSTSRSSCASSPPTTRCSHPRTGATPPTWRCTCSRGWTASGRSARSSG